MKTIISSLADRATQSVIAEPATADFDSGALAEIGAPTGLSQSCRETLANEVFNALCGASPDEHDALLSKSDDWMSTGYPANGPAAQSRCADFQDSSVLGDWDGYDLCSVQEVLQDIFDQAEQMLIAELSESA